MRYTIFYVILLLLSIAVIARMVDLQIVNGEMYLERSERKLYRTLPVSAPRGEIADRFGRVLVKNRTAFAITIEYSNDRTDEQLNAMIVSLYGLLKAHAVSLSDTLPISEGGDTFLFDDNPEREEKWKKQQNMASDISPADAMTRLALVYNVSPSFTPVERRVCIGQRYEMEIAGFSRQTPYMFAQGIPLELLAIIKEFSIDYPNIGVSMIPMRQYANEGLAAHLLGHVGRIYKEEYKSYEEKGYTMNALVGKQGLEKFLEEYIRGHDGLSRIEQSMNGVEISNVNSKEPIPGNTAILSIDIELQAILEQALADNIEQIRVNSRYERNNAGFDAYAGAAVVIDVNSGDVLAIASHPTYDIAKFFELYSSLAEDKNKPLFNRALSGAYAPGSTFKMLSAIAALETGNVKLGEKIRCTGVFRLGNFSFRCNGVHGNMDVIPAITRSCNYFFYEAARRTNITKMNEYARAFGFGSVSGIEIPGEETAGILAGPQYREKNNMEWYPGDTVQSAIGQSDNLFTPLQLANYVATIANGGTLYRPKLVSSIHSATDGSIVKEFEPEVLNTIDLKPENYRAVIEGMRRVTTSGTAARTFAGATFTSAGKTGTAEVPDGSDNGIFVGFAPFENPQIAIAIVVEHGAHGDSVAPTARRIFEAYLHRESEPDVINSINEFVR